MIPSGEHILAHVVIFISLIEREGKWDRNIKCEYSSLYTQKQWTRTKVIEAWYQIIPGNKWMRMKSVKYKIGA